MAWPTSLQVALKEWATVCTALENGRQILLLRKGGIYEAAGEFELQNRAFLLFPTYLHQNRKMLKPEAHAGFQPVTAEPGQVRLSAADLVTAQVANRGDAPPLAIGEPIHVSWSAADGSVFPA